MVNYSIIVTGNGYDLAQEYPTKYEDFYLCVKEAVTLTMESFLDNHKNAKDAGSFYNSVVRVKSKSNLYIKYILGTEKIYGRWCDFESELKSILETFDYILENGTINNMSSPRHLYFKLNNKLVLNLFDKKIVGVWKDLALNVERIGIGFIYYMKESKSDYFTTAENEKTIKKKICDYLDLDLDDFKELFIQYLVTFVDEIPEKISPKYKADYVFTFNYTECSKSLCSKTFVPLHGNIKDKEIVLGVDDNTKFLNKELTKHTKLTQQSLLNSIDVLSILNESIGPWPTIAYYGLSFNESDKTSILDFLRVDNAIHHIYCFDRNQKKEIASNLQDFLGIKEYSEMLKAKRIIYYNWTEFFNLKVKFSG